jgi:type IV pilus assembly protein PilB
VGNQFPAKDIVAFIGQTPLFGGCEVNDLFALVETGEQSTYDAGATILPPGKPVVGLGILLRGKAELLLVDAASGGRTVVEKLVSGSFFGEVGMLLGSGNPLSVVAEEPCVTLVIAQDRMARIFRKNPEVCLALAKRVSARFVKLSMLGLQQAAPAGAAAPVPASPPPVARADAVREEDESPDRIGWVDVGSYTITEELLHMIPAQIIAKHRLLPLELHGRKLTIGMVNPRSVEALQELRRVLHSVDPHVVAISADGFSQAYVRLKLDGAGPAKEKAAAEGKRGPQQLVYAVEQEKEADKAKLYIGHEVVGLLDRVIGEAVDRGASDIHIEPESAVVKVRYRVQGMLVERKEFIANSYAAPLIQRIKVLAELDTTERRLPQDGRIIAQLGRLELNLRVSTIPVARGEKAVIRIIDSADAMRPLHQIALNPTLEKSMRTALAEPFGAIVVAGPTGSGKSSTLYSMLNERRLARPDTSIVTVEDPVEYLLQGVTQVPVIPRVNFGFNLALKGLMRQDPDVIMIGELRDTDTTTIMVEAALTGHLVLTSIHGNHSTAVIQRLQHLGTNPVLLSQALSLIVVQRLAKRLCPNCAVEGEVAPALLENLIERRIVAPGAAAGIKLPRPKGCDSCDQTGYLGRVAVQEIMSFDDAVRNTLASGASPEELVAKAKERKRFYSFAQAASYLMARRVLSPGDALLIVAD